MGAVKEAILKAVEAVANALGEPEDEWFFFYLMELALGDPDEFLAKYKEYIPEQYLSLFQG